MLELFGIERIPRARRIKTKNEQIIAIENMSVEDEDLREVPRSKDLPFDAIFTIWKIQIARKTLESS